MTDALRRLVNLYGLLLQAHELAPLTLTNARDRLRDEYDDYERESGRRAFLRDRERLEVAGVPLRMTYATGVAGVPGWWIPRDEWFLGHLDLENDERDALLRATRMVDFEDVLWSRLAGAKLGAREIGTTETVAVFVAPPALPALQEARSRRATVTFGYRNRDRTVDPYTLANANGHWYLVGHDHFVDEVRVYRVDRIDGRGVQVGDDGSFTVPDDVDARAHVPADRWSFGGEPFEVRVAVDREVAAIVERDAGGGLTRAERDDGRVELAFLCGHPGVFTSWVLGLGHRAEVLAPAHLRDEVVARLRTLAELGELGENEGRHAS